VDSSTLCGCVSDFGGGGVRKVGIGWNRTADSRMVLTDRQDITAGRSAKHCRDMDWGILGSVSECGRGALLFQSEKLTTICCVGLMIKFNIC
jgi:hypothetical protein